MMTNIRVLVTGASGAIGSEVLKQLYLSKKFRITVFDIKTPKSVNIFSKYGQEIEIIYGDLGSKQDLKSACIEKDIVIHLAAIIPPLADECPDLANRVNVSGSGNLIKTLELHSPNTFLFYSSSISIYGDRVLTPNIKVSDPLIPNEGDEYAKTKMTTEKLIENSKLNWSIFRLCAVMGKHKVSKLMFHQPLNTSFEIATLEDTARAFVNAIEKRGELAMKIYNLGGGEKCRSSYKEFLKRSFKINGLGKFDFAQGSFAEKNFHCGFYQDGDDLENIIHFRKDSLESFFQKEKEKISMIRKIFVSIFRRPIKFYLQRQSEPLQAYKKNDQKAIQHYFASREFISKVPI